MTTPNTNPPERPGAEADKVRWLSTQERDFVSPVTQQEFDAQAQEILAATGAGQVILLGKPILIDEGVSDNVIRFRGKSTVDLVLVEPTEACRVCGKVKPINEWCDCPAALEARRLSDLMDTWQSLVCPTCEQGPRDCSCTVDGRRE